MDALCKPNTSTNSSIRNSKKVRNKLADKSCKYIAAKINCIASEKRCSCCGGISCKPQPCGHLNVPVEIESPSSEKKSSSGETEFCEEPNHVEEICAGKPSWELCKGKIDEKPEYSENEIGCFIEVIKQKLRDSSGRKGGQLVCGNNFPHGEISGTRNGRGTCSENNIHGEYFEEDVCAASSTCKRDAGVKYVDEEKIALANETVQDIRGSNKPIIFRHEKRYQEYSHVVGSDVDFEARSLRVDFKIGDIGRSEELSKWGELDIADRLLANYKKTISLKRPRIDEDDVVDKTKDKFDELDRFSYLDKKGFATLCRQLFRWSYRLSKKWRTFNSQPHVVIHLCSIGYPFEIRRRASRNFDFIQNLQVGRLGWLSNENAQVLYIFPSNQSLEMITLFRDLIKNVRPDVADSKLWIIQPERGECSKIECLNGSRALFQTPETYRRVKMLTAGRQAFILPGVIEEIDIFIASELRAPIMGPPLEFQNHFLNKSNVANFLKEMKVDQPPFVPDVRNFSELCKGLARLMIEFPNYLTWLIKINYGINGLQTASINFEKNSSREIITKKTEEALAVFLMEILPGEMTLNKRAYKNGKEFFCDLEKYGGLIQACPSVDYRILSFGVFVEHDAAIPKVCASADVFHVPNDITTDLCYGIPQATTARLPLENLVVNVGIALREWHYIGYFGMDVVALKDDDDDDRMDKFFVVDIDPHYTDVIAFTDWIRFCLGVDSSCQCCRSSDSHGQKNEKGQLNPEDTMERYAICSGKLYSNGLAKYCGRTLVSLCEERNLRYNFKIKQGSMICPIDSELRALGLVSLYPKRARAIDEFAKGLRVLHELSLEKHNDRIKTNMLMILGVFELAALSVLTGCLVTLAALSHVLEWIFIIVNPTINFLLDQVNDLILTEVLLADLCTKAPFLQSVLRPEYATYLNTAGTVILGWIVVAWISNLIWSLIAPLTISALAVAMVCPTTVKWVLRQVAPNQELTVLKFVESFQAVIPDF